MKTKFNAIILSRPIIYAVIALVAAIILRFLRFEDFITFGHDNSRDNIVAYKMFAYSEYIYVGPVFSVIWGYMSPIYYYMLYPFFVLFKFSPISAPVASMVANIATLFLLAYVAFRLYGKAASFVVILLFGFSVYIIKHGGEGLNPSLMLPFSVLGFYSYFQWLKTGRSKLLYTFAFSLSFITALHPAGFFILVPLSILYFFYKPKLKIKSLLVALGIYGLLGVLPYLIQEKKLAWWTIKQFIEYIKSSDGGTPFLQSIPNFFIAVLKNISLTLFNHTHDIGLVFGGLILGFIAYEAFTFIRKKNNSNVLAFTLFLYLIVFGFLVKFENSEPHTKWFVAVFVPLLVLYISSLLTRLYRTNYWYSSLLILAGLLILNVHQFITIPYEDDSYTFMKEVTEVIRDDSEGEDFDIYGGNPEPIFYMLWYYETNSELKGKYLSWFKWTKEKDDELVYFVESKYPLDHNKIEEIKDKHGTETYEVLYTSPIGNKIYIFK